MSPQITFASALPGKTGYTKITVFHSNDECIAWIQPCTICL